MRLVTIVGARPQFIKATPVSAALKDKNIQEIIVHTGQHYDQDMSAIFFKELEIQEPRYNLGIQAATHGAMTGRMLEQVEKVLMDENPDLVLVYGDTNSTLAGALAAVKLNIPVAHVEAGLRSFNRRMPEEINRVLTDHIAAFLFAPTTTAVENLKNEAINRGVYLTGDVMYDAALKFGKISEKTSTVLERLNLQPRQYYLATLHRAENTDDPARLQSIFKALAILNETRPVVLPMHPRTAKAIKSLDMKNRIQELCVTQPLPFLDMVALEKSARVIITDSGGVQKEAYFHSVPCVTMRDETEWIETTVAGWNTITGADSDKIVRAAQSAKKGRPIDEYGTGQAAGKMARILFSNSTTLPPQRSEIEVS